MARVNISVPDELAARVRELALPVSAICQGALRAAAGGGSATGTGCAPCLAGLCRHEACKTPASAAWAVTAVAGTPSCGECAGALLELVLHPPAPLVMTVPPAVP